jgi:hypothetical protein
MARSNRSRAQPAADAGGPSKTGDLLAEIEALRELIARVLELTADERPAGELLRLMEGLSRSSTHLADLLLAQKKLNAEQSGAQMLRALEELNRELRHSSK